MVASSARKPADDDPYRCRFFCGPMCSEGGTSVAQPLSSIDKVSIIGGDASGVSGISGNVPVLMAQTMEAMKEATGIDMRDIVRANSIEAKTDRNITIKTEDEE